MSVRGFCAATGLSLFLAFSSAPGLLAEVRSPQSGEVYREFPRILGGGRDWRVTDPNTPLPDARSFLPNSVLSFNLPAGSLVGAIRAEVVVAYWGGHVGTSGQQIRFNGNSWLDVPDLATTPTSADCYTQQWNPVIAVPLSHIQEGGNTMDATSAGQICYDFDWGQWGWYATILRIYYDPAAVVHPTGSITLPLANAALSENPAVRVVTSTGVDRVEVFARYEGPDFDGDGQHLEYHQEYQRAQAGTTIPTTRHVGTDTTTPFDLVWDTDLVPDQAGIRLLARIRNTSGVWFVTDAVTGLRLFRPTSSVALFKSHSVPESFWTRAHRRNVSSKITIPPQHDLTRLTSAKLILRSWNGIDGAAEAGQTHFTRLNSYTIPPNFGKNHYYSLDVFSLPGSAVRSGENVFTVDSASTHHGIEILWPGPDLVLRFSYPSSIACGNGLRETGEECDDGNLAGSDGCEADCSFPGAGVCGDGNINHGEQCDDGNRFDGDSCTSSCTLPPQPSALPAMLPFEETTGDLTEDIANDNDGMLEGAVRTASGKFGRAVAFDGVNDRVNLGALDIGGQQATLALWFKADDFGVPEARLLSKASGPNEQDHFWMLGTVSQSGNRLRVRLRTQIGGTLTVVGTGATISAGVWTHVAATYDGSMLRLYKDGQLVGSAAKTGMIGGNAGVPVWIGDQPGGGQPFDGVIDEVLIDDRAWLPSELQPLLTHPLSVPDNICGDGDLDPGEACDDGNEIDGDGCRRNCQLPGCGDGVLDSGEECDDGNDLDGDGCQRGCELPVCGDGIRDPGEACDDGNRVPSDECNNDCQSNLPPNLLVNGDFSAGSSNWLFYSDGSASFNAGSGAAQVSIGSSGNNVQLYQIDVALRGNTPYRLRFTARNSGGDDAIVGLIKNTSPFTNYGLSRAVNLGTTDQTFEILFTSTAGDKTDARFLVALGNYDRAGFAYVFDDFVLEKVRICGDSYVDAGEQCDDGNTIDGDGCDAACQIGVCGDGETHAEIGEQCDDGNDVDGDGCRADCTAEVCGDRIVDPGEDCDDGNPLDGDGCESDCTPTPLPECGNADVEAGEACDDGNHVDGDGCRADCTVEACGDGIVDPGEDCDSGPGIPADWYGGERRYRVGLALSAQGHARNDRVVEVGLALPTLLAQAGGSGSVHRSSLLLVEVSAAGALLDFEVPFQFDGTSSGTLVWLAEGATASNATRYYQLYFDTSAFVAPSFPDQVVVTDNVMDAGQLSFEVVTAAATYLYQKEGGSFSSLIDAGGNDWLSYSTAPGSAGAFRGMPNMFGSPVIYHPGATTASSFLVSDGPLKASVESPSDNGQQRLRWDFYPGSARMTMLQATGSYWFLYEGTPGGVLERNGNDIVVRSNGSQTSAATSWTGDITGSDEWLYFGDQALGRSLFLAHHTSDTIIDSYFPYDDVAGGPDSDWMTVFGFGRNGATALLSGASRQFTIGLIDGVALAAAQAAIESAYKAVQVAVGTAEVVADAPADGCRPDCTLPTCGDGLDEEGEDCDDGNLTSGDGCDEQCRTEACGNGRVDAGEPCDDGNLTAGDGCDALCRTEACGNSRVDAGEQCDDGNLATGDGCDAQCRREGCGNGRSDPGEGCDDGNLVPGDGCDDQCRTEVCGNGRVDAAEDCEDGNFDAGDGCDSQCRTEVCGNGRVDAGEQCDDGNLAGGDACAADCTIPPPSANLLRNGDFSAGATHWSFYSNGSAGFNASSGEARIPISVSGTNVQLYQVDVPLQGGTAYRLRLRARNTGGDDAKVELLQHTSPYANLGLSRVLDLTAADQTFEIPFTTVPGSLGSTRFRLWLAPYDRAANTYFFDDIVLEPAAGAAVCGNGLVEAGEPCDDGNLTPGDGCDALCRTEACGNGRVDAGEACDDGNLGTGDGCDALCRTEACGNGRVDAGEGCDDGNLTPGDGCDALCRTEACGNGRVDAGEACDDGNLTTGDGCDALCRTENCGNGGLDAGEGCDDGNLTAGDGCDALCRTEACGNGRVDAGEGCDDGNLAPGDGCDGQCRTEVCGNGRIDAGEQCDDGNLAGGDACAADCTIPPPSANILRNGDFSEGAASWSFNSNGSAGLSASTGEARIAISLAGTNVQLYQAPIVLRGNTQYRLRFRGRNTFGDNARLHLIKHGSPYSNYGLNQVVDLTSTTQEFTLLFTTTPGDKTDARLMIMLSEFDRNGAEYYFDDFELVQVVGRTGLGLVEAP